MTRKLMLVLVVPLVLSACVAGLRIRHDQAPDADPGAAETFGFFAPLGTDRDGYVSLLSQRLKAATRRELQAKGYRFVEEQPDLLVNFGARLDERVRTTVEPAGAYGYYGYRRGYYGGWVGYSQRVESHREGTLNIDVVDPKTMLLIWEGVAVGRVDEATLDDVEERTDAAVVDILRAFPVRR